MSNEFNDIMYRAFIYRLKEEIAGGSFGAARIQRVFKINYRSSCVIIENLLEMDVIEKSKKDKFQWCIK